MKLPLLALAISYAVFFGCVFATYGDLPLRVASHFDIAGRPNGWMDRMSYLIFTFAMALGLPLFMVGITALTGRLGRGLNIPHRDYWLAPERRQSTVAAVMRFVVSLSALVVVLVTAVHVLVVRAISTRLSRTSIRPPSGSSSSDSSRRRRCGVGCSTGNFPGSLRAFSKRS